MKVYVAGPMSGIPRCNVPAFDRAAAALRKQGYDVISPAELDSPEERMAMLADDAGFLSGDNWFFCLGRDIALLEDVDGIVLLPGWHKSKGAKLEAYTGLLTGLKFFRYFPTQGEIVCMRSSLVFNVITRNTEVDYDEL